MPFNRRQYPGAAVHLSPEDIPNLCSMTSVPLLLWIVGRHERPRRHQKELHHHESLDPVRQLAERSCLCRWSLISTARVRKPHAGRSRLGPHDEGVDIRLPPQKAVAGKLAKHCHNTLKRSRPSDQSTLSGTGMEFLVHLNAGMQSTLHLTT